MTENFVDTPHKIQTQIIGKVVSNKMSKTIVVEIERKEKHAVYGKYIKRFSKMYAHDESSLAKTGDVVLIVNTRPLSKLKRWKLVEIIKSKEQE